MRKIYLLFALLPLLCLKALAGPALPRPFTFTQPDGTILSVELHGDEFSHYMTLSGSQERMAVGVDGYLRPAPEEDDSEALRRSAARRSAAAQQVLSRRASASSWKGSKHFLVLLVEFSDLEFKTSDARSAFSDLLNESGYSAGGATGSAYDYLYENSMGAFKPVFDVYGPVKLPQSCAYYGGNDSSGNDLRPGEALSVACHLLDSQIDFSKYDHDGDGYVDQVFFYYAGYSEAEGASSDTIWPHSYTLSEAVGLGETIDYKQFDGVTVDMYACASELSGTSGTSMTAIGTFLHEFMHVLGLPDIYNTSNSYLQPMYKFSIMDHGLYNDNSHTPPYLCAFERALLGWMDEPERVSGGFGALRSISYNEALKIDCDVTGECYVLEYRDGTGWDAGVGESGLVIYHLDRSSNKVDGSTTAADLWTDWRSSNAVNAYSGHYCCYIVKSYSGFLGIGASYVYPGTSSVSTISGFSSWSGASVGSTVRSITVGDGWAMFAYGDELYNAGINAIANPGRGVYSSGEKFPLMLISSSNAPSSVTWYYDGVAVSGSSVTLTSGTHAVKAVLTYSSGKGSSGSTETLEQEITVK